MQNFSDLISVSALQESLFEPGWRIVDCRFDLMNPDQGYADFLAAHLPGAVYAHLDNDLAAPVTPDSGRHPLPDPADFVQTLSGLGISNGDQVVVYDGGGGALAARLWWMLRWLGHTRVAILDGGFAAWQRAGAAVKSGATDVKPGKFSGQPDHALVLTTAELEQRLAAGESPILVDAREAQRFSGQSEPIDSAAGHVPGALNYPFALNLRQDGHWQDPAVLADHWRQVLPGIPADDWAVMCGSGVTACHLAVSAKLAGRPLPRLYAGSWSEWLRDPARPRSPAA